MDGIYHRLPSRSYIVFHMHELDFAVFALFNLRKMTILLILMIFMISLRLIEML